MRIGRKTHQPTFHCEVEDGFATSSDPPGSWLLRASASMSCVIAQAVCRSYVGNAKLSQGQER